MLDKLPFSLIYKLNEGGDAVTEIVVKNLIMSSAQIIIHRRDNNHEYEMTSENISDRCKAILRLLETKSVANSVNQVLRNLDNICLLYTSPSPRDRTRSRMPSSA